LVTISDSLIIA